MRRPNSIPGLLLHLVRTRWAALGRTGKLLALAGLVVGAATALSMATCLFGGCPVSSSPCGMRSAESSPCGMRAAAAESDPCPYAAQQAALAAHDDGEEDEDDEKKGDDEPCH